MGYDVSLYKVPVELKDQKINDEVLFDIAYGDDNENFLLADTNFSLGNPNSIEFAMVFDIALTNNDFFKIYRIGEYNEAKNRLQTMSLDDEMKNRINNFLNIIDHELNKGELIFFCCG